MPNFAVASHACITSASDMPTGVEAADRRDGRLADADGADVGALDEGYFDAGAGKMRRKRGRGHPARGAAADDDDPLDRSLCPTPVLIGTSDLFGSGIASETAKNGPADRRLPAQEGWLFKSGRTPTSNAARTRSASGTASSPCRTGSNIARSRRRGSMRFRNAKFSLMLSVTFASTYCAVSWKIGILPKVVDRRGVR